MAPQKTREKFIEAARDGDLKRLKTLVPERSCNWAGDWDVEALHIASQRGYCSIVIWLLDDCRTDIMQTDLVGRCALLYAAQNGHVAVVNALLERHAEVDFMDIDRRTSLMNASENGHTAVVASLLRGGGNVSLWDLRGETALTLAAGAAGSVELVKMLLEANAFINHKNSVGDTALIKASVAGKVDVVNFLLEKRECNLSHANDFGDTALTCSIMSKTSQKEDVLGVLLEQDAREYLAMRPDPVYTLDSVVSPMVAGQ